jgi:nicotinic acid mononucleotide adenylyltransferase
MEKRTKVESLLSLSQDVQNLHSFSIPTRILEVGCGLALSNLLFSENDASHTIYDVQSPYSRDAQLKISPELANHRAVSLDTTKILMESLYLEQGKQLAYYVADFQIGGASLPKTTHGYIGVAGPDQIATYYHVTIPKESSRGWLLNAISQVGFAILYNKMIEINLVDNPRVVTQRGGRIFTILPIEHVDQTFNQKGEQIVDETLKHFLESEVDNYNCYYDNLLCYHRGQFHRFEEFFRDKENILIYRGTFNPITNAHLEIFNKAVEQEKPDFACLMVAHSIFGKSGLNFEEIKQRMSYADALKLPLLIGNSFRYTDLIKHFRQRQFAEFKNSAGKPTLKFLMGVDTIERIFDFESNQDLEAAKLLTEEDCKVKVNSRFFHNTLYQKIVYLYCDRTGYSISLERSNLFADINSNEYLKIAKLKEFEDKDGISATQVREFLKNANLEETAKLIPEKILQTIIKNQLIKC